MLAAFFMAIPQYTIKMEDLLQGNFTHPDARLCEILICCHLLQKAGLDNGKNLNDIDRQWLKKLGEPKFDEALFVSKIKPPTKEEKKRLETEDHLIDGERLVIKFQNAYLCLEPDWEAIKRISGHCLFFNKERGDFIVIFNPLPRPREQKYAESIHTIRNSRPEKMDTFFNASFILTDSSTEGAQKFLNKYYKSLSYNDLIYYNSPVRRGYPISSLMDWVKIKIGEIAEEHKIYEPKVTLAGFGIGAGKAEIARLGKQDFCWNWDMDVYALNSPDLFVGKEGLAEYLKIVGNKYHPIKANIPNAPVITEKCGEPWFRGYDYRKAQPQYAITVPDLKCEWSASLRYPKTNLFRDYLPYLRILK